MFSSVQYTYCLVSDYPKPYVPDENALYSNAQDHSGVHPSMLGALYAPATNYEVSPWAWQWSEGVRYQEVGDSPQSPSTQYTQRVSLRQDSFTHHSYMASTTQPQVHPTYAVDRAPPAFSRVVGGPVSNTNRLEIACPRPRYPLPKWIDMTGWEDDETEATPEEDVERTDSTPGPVDNDTDWEGVEWSDEEDYDEEFDVPHRFLPSSILSPDPEELPAPFFHPASDSTPPSRILASLSPEACDLPQPRFDTDPYSPVSNVSSRSNVPELSHPRSSPCSSFDIVSPDPEDLPPPEFEMYDRFEFPGRLDRRRDRLGEGLWKVVTGGGRKVSGSGHRRRWLDWSWRK